MIPVTPSRTIRVDSVLSSKPHFSEFVSKRTQKVKRDNGSEVEVSEAVVNITKSLCDSGTDPCACTKEKIMLEASAIVGVTPDASWQSVGELTDSRIRRVYSVLKNSNAATLFDSNKTVIQTSKGEVSVPSDAVAIAKLIHAAGKNACALTRDDIYGFANAYFQTKNKTVQIQKSTPASDGKGGTRMEARVSRVEGVLRDDPALCDKLSNPDVSMQQRGGGTALHSKEAYELTKKLVDGGVDVMALSKKDILHKAVEFFGIGAKATAPTAPATPASAPSVPLAAQAAPVATPVARVAARSTPVLPEVRPAAEGNRGLNKKVNFALSVYTLLIAAMELANLDKIEGTEKRISDLEKIAKEYAKAANVVF